MQELENTQLEKRKNFFVVWISVELIKDKKLSEMTLLLIQIQQKGLFTKFLLFDKFDRNPDNKEIFACF
jgi:uncharacterized membrane protein YobD (UPF0266 family)